jgi:hypothetical protein
MLNEKKTLQWGDLPIEVQERMLEEQVAQGNKRDPSVFEDAKNANALRGGFDWDKSPEKAVFWHNVLYNRDLTAFYALHHPKVKTDPAKVYVLNYTKTFKHPMISGAKTKHEKFSLDRDCC